jgi:hypothetical protein
MEFEIALLSSVANRKLIFMISKSFFFVLLLMMSFCDVVSQDLASSNTIGLQRYELDAYGHLVPARAFSTKRTMDDHNNSIGFGMYILPPAIVNAESVIAYIEFERFINERNAILGRLEFIGYNFEEDEPSYYESETGLGGGIGFSYRHYFSDYGGFFLSPGVEVGLVAWDYNYYTKFSGSSGEWERGTSLAIAPNLSAGYCINFGSRVSFTPAVMLGYRIGIGLESDDDTENGNAPIGGFGVSIKFRFSSEN